MAITTEIEWTDATWNPTSGCSKIARGCDFCYAERFSERFRGVPGHAFENGFDPTLRPERLAQPARPSPEMIPTRETSTRRHNKRSPTPMSGNLIRAQRSPRPEPASSAASDGWAGSSSGPDARSTI
ncbi:MAG: DUF5131 family protein [Methylovirgula sp.]